ncbi:MAG TPA: ATP-dependent Clp protease ATP-binding subunit ClpX [Sphaerochaeta sp.]|nr:ATP-dependent Clp protease ATP-binding subunit ClpX [Sphaerochaeta sp.]
MAKHPRSCSFCGKNQDEVRRLISGPGVAICDECVAVCNDMLSSDPSLQQEPAGIPEEIPTPRELKEYMDEYVIGQEDAKRVLAVAVHNHYKRVKFRKEIAEQGVELDKSNILMVGPTGTGKTLLASTLAKKLQVPFAIADATTLTEAGYVGEDVENILLKLIQNADGNIAAAESGIIFVDEIDKIAKKGENPSITRDVSGEGVQQALLKIIEGTEANVPPQGGRKHPSQEMLKINTSNILFICGGAFVGLDKVIEKRVSSHAMGFGAPIIKSQEKDLKALYKQLMPDDLIKFGLIPEFIGRLPIHVSLDNLSEQDLQRIIVEPKNSIIRQYEAAFNLDGIEFIFRKEAVEAVAQKAYEQKTGARGLRSIVENVMMGIMFDIPSMESVKQVIVTKECILDGKEPEIVLGA